MNRQDIIDLIVSSNKEQEFIDGWRRDPREYFQEYSHAEPEIWVHVLMDLEIPVNFCTQCMEDFGTDGRDNHWPTMHPRCAEKWLREMDDIGFNKREEWSGFE